MVGLGLRLRAAGSHLGATDQAHRQRVGSRGPVRGLSRHRRQHCHRGSLGQRRSCGRSLRIRAPGRELGGAGQADGARRRAPWDCFGWSVALDGDKAVAGAKSDEDAGEWSGSAYVFARQGATWTQQAKLTAGDAGQGDAFGTSVSISGGTVLVGALVNKPIVDYGAAYVFVQSGAKWLQQDRLTVDDAGPSPMFGFSVAVSGGTSLVGAPSDFDLGGSAYVFDRPPASACTVPADCPIGSCVDGYCCDDPCGGGVVDDCLACSIAAGGTADGFCTALADGSPCLQGACPHGSCEPPGEGGAAGSASGGAGGHGGSGGAGTGGSGPGPVPDGVTGSPQDVRPGCGCRLSPLPPRPPPAALLPLLALALPLRRKRASRASLPISRLLGPASLAYGENGTK
ncbi:MAG: FG-GAP repeat protein [Deltaproteobacteria bacterium]|nr:FG-GAP repeat protein [Deltaproteobacteria bacterium]